VALEATAEKVGWLVAMAEVTAVAMAVAVMEGERPVAMAEVVAQRVEGAAEMLAVAAG
jgi:hypothetical protein